MTGVLSGLAMAQKSPTTGLKSRWDRLRRFLRIFRTAVAFCLVGLVRVFT